MKRTIWVRRWATVMCGLLLLAACGDDKTNTGAADSTGGGSASQVQPSGAPIKVGMLGLFSGVGGPVHIPKRQTYEAWTKMVNANGGINGHPVELIAKDHGGNQAQAVSMAKDMVENDKVVALVVTGSVEGGVVQYAQEAGVPVIGVGAGPFDQAQNPFMFKTGPDSATTAKNTAQQVKAAGYKKVAAMYCSEAPGCKAGSDFTVKAMKDAGIEVVYETAISLTAPDYTAECVQAKDAGADLIFPTTNNTTPPLIASSCDRQGYNPAFLLGSASDEQAGDETLNGSITIQGTFPWFLREGSPGVEEYASALEKYASDLLTKGTSDIATSWIAAKVFQKAAETGIAAGEAPTPAMVLKGLYAMHGYDVEGLMPDCMAVSYTEGQATSPVGGSFLGKIEDGKWVAPDGLTPLCSG